MLSPDEFLSSSACSGKEPLEISGTDLLQAGRPSSQQAKSVKALNGTHNTDPVALSFPDPLPDDHTSGKGHCIVYAALHHQQLGLCNHKIYYYY